MRQGGETDLDKLLAGLEPVLDDHSYMFVGEVITGALMVFHEDEGPTSIAIHDGRDSPVWRRITLTVHSSLQAVGLTAAVSAVLAEAGIPANMVAALRHDHVFVPDMKAEQALAVLQGQSDAARLK